MAVSNVRAVNTLRKIVANHADQEHLPQHMVLQCALLATQDFLHLVVQRHVKHVRQALILHMERQSA